MSGKNELDKEEKVLMAKKNYFGDNCGLLSDLPLPCCSLGLDALVPSRLGVRLNVGNFGEFLKKGKFG